MEGNWNYPVLHCHSSWQTIASVTKQPFLLLILKLCYLFYFFLKDLTLGFVTLEMTVGAVRFIRAWQLQLHCSSRIDKFPVTSLIFFSDEQNKISLKKKALCWRGLSFIYTPYLSNPHEKRRRHKQEMQWYLPHILVCVCMRAPERLFLPTSVSIS